jgi:tRNA A37 threonylcarbamoyladenosine synthetase subunit TsaC/SUA5/YrdC
MLSRIWKAKSLEIFKPTGCFTSSEEAIKTFQEQRTKTLQYVNTTSDDLRNHFWKHPLTGTIDLYQTLILMSAHLERHIDQIEKVKAASNFPKQ